MDIKRRSPLFLLLLALFVSIDVRFSVAQTLTGFGSAQLLIDTNGIVTNLNILGQDQTSATVGIAQFGTFGGIFKPNAFDWSNVTAFGLLMSVPTLNPNQSFTIDFFNSNISGEIPRNFYIARFTGTTTGVSNTLSVLSLTKDNTFTPPDGGPGGLNNFSDVAGVQFTWNSPTTPGTSTTATLGGLVGLTSPLQPVITSISHSGNAFSMTWTGTGFVPVIVQRRQSLDSGIWTAVAQGVVSGQYTDPNPPAGKAFYRVVVP